MSNLKREIQLIELDIQSNLNALVTLKKDLAEKVSSIKSNILLTEMMVMSFSLGYMMTPARTTVKSPARYSAVIIFLEIKRVVSGIVSQLFKLSK